MTLLIFVLAVAHTVISRYANQALVTPITPAGIVNLELAKKPENVRMIREVIDTDVVRLSLMLDTEYILLYTFFFCFLLNYFITGLKRRAKTMSGIGVALFVVTVMAGLLDFTENIMLWRTFVSQTSIQTVGLSYYASVTKFALVLLIVMYLIFAYLASVINKRRFYKRIST